MSLPTCKACGQSVLDEDVDDCPWCGASLKTGKPSSTPKQPSAPSRPSTPTPVSTAQPAPERPAATKTADKQESDDPFAVDTSAAAQAVPARPKPAKGRTYKVVCPMCETVGFVPRKAAGRDVRCANPKCLVPIFTAPEITVAPAEPQQPQKSGLSAGALTAGGVVLLLAAGVGIWHFVLRDPGGPPSIPPPPPVKADGNEQTVISAADGSDTPANGQTAGKSTDTANGATSDPSPPQIAPQEMQRLALDRMVAAAQQRDRNRSKPYCRRLTAEAFALLGDLGEARTQIDHLANVGGEVPFYRITPLIAIAWKQLQGGDREAAARTVDEALAVAPSLPQYGRDAVDSATALAAVLAALGREGEADALLERISEADAVRQQSAHWHIARALEDYDFDLVAEWPLIPWSAPQRVAVTVDLFCHGYSTEAVRWAQRSPTLRGQSDGLAAWAAVVTRRAIDAKQVLPQAEIESAARGTPPAVGARLHISVAHSALDAGDKAAAESALQAARKALSGVQEPVELRLPGMKDLYSLELPDPDPLQTAALAYAELADVETALGDSDAAWTSLHSALQFVRAMAPSPPAIEARLQEIDALGSAALARELGRLLELETADKARIAARNYQKTCLAIEEAAARRFVFQLALLEPAADGDLRDRLWAEVQDLARHPQADTREPYFESSLPWSFAAAYRAAGDESKAKEIEAALSGAQQARDPWLQLKQSTADLLAAGNVSAAARQIERSRLDKAQRFGWLLQLLGRSLRAGNVDEALALTGALEDAVWREDSLELLSAQAAKRGHADRIWRFLEQSNLTATEQVSVCRGLIAGLQAAADG